MVETGIMDKNPAHRRFWETYTPHNILNEVRLRWAAWADRHTRARARHKAGLNYDGRHAVGVGEFYDAHHAQFMRVYGEVIQAFRTRNVVDLLDGQMRSMALAPGQRVLDAGCGVAAPAVHFARHADVFIDAITISRVQAEAAEKKVAAAGLAERVKVTLGDYHRLDKYFAAETYDVVYFLESFGHSAAKKVLIDSAWNVLKPGGTLYIKDLFRRIPLAAEHAASIDREIRKINAAYRYQVGDLNEVLDALRGRGFILTSMKAVELELQQFEDLAISNEFQELTGLARIEDWNAYVFPVDFFEIKCAKPEFSLTERLDRYFLQHRYHRHLAGSREPDGERELNGEPEKRPPQNR